MNVRCRHLENVTGTEKNKKGPLVRAQNEDGTGRMRGGAADHLETGDEINPEPVGENNDNEDVTEPW
jgi:hypothetical protein